MSWIRRLFLTVLLATALASLSGGGAALALNDLPPNWHIIKGQPVCITCWNR